MKLPLTVIGALGHGVLVKDGDDKPFAVFYGGSVQPDGLANAQEVVACVNQRDNLPSRFQLGETVRARGVTAKVSGICFRAAKVFYEVGGVMHESNDVTEPMRMVKP